MIEHRAVNPGVGGSSPPAFALWPVPSGTDLVCKAKIAEFNPQTGLTPP